MMKKNKDCLVPVQSLHDVYNWSLGYNSELQSDLNTANEALKRVEKEKADVVAELSTLRDHYSSLQEQLTLSRSTCLSQSEQNRGLQEQLALAQEKLEDLSSENVKYKEYTESLTTKTSELESTCLSQSEQNRGLQEQLALAQKKLQEGKCL